jgi:glycosyltransferase involved in cell wall biosynthesis
MKILLLNQYYPPDTSATARVAASFAEALAARHETTVLCGRPSYDPTTRRAWRVWQTEQMGNVCVIRVGSTDYSRTKMHERVLNYLTYVALSVPRALLVPCDVVLAMTDPPFEGIVGAFVAMLKHKRYVYNIQDMYPDMAVGGSIVAPGVLARVWERMHRWALRRAARVIVIGDDMRRRIIAKGVEPQQVVVVRNGTELRPVQPQSDGLNQEVIRTIRGDARLVLVHAGNIGFYGAWQTLVSAAQALSGEGVHVVFVGDGAQRRAVAAAAANAPNVRFLPFFPAADIGSVLAAADAHIVTVKRGLEGVVVPSKMYGILAAGRPLLTVAPAETDAAWICRERGAGLWVEPDKPAELIAILREVLGQPERLAAMGRAARVVAADYERANEWRKFVSAIEELS